MKLLVLSKIDSQALRALDDAHDVVTAINPRPDTLPPLVADREAIILRSGVELTSSVLDRAPFLRLLVRAGSGTDNIDQDYLVKRGIELCRVPGPGAQSVAEMAFAHMLVLARRVLEADRSMRAGEWRKAELEGRTLTGKTLGIIGLGNIGSRVAHLGVAWGMRVIGCVENPSEERAAAFAERGVTLRPCDEVLRLADYVSIHVPLKAENRGLIGSRELDLMKPAAYLVNLARGGVVDEEALADALRTGRLAGAGLDVHDHENDGQLSPLAGLENVVLTPHLGASTVDSQREIGREVVRLIEAFCTEPARSEPAIATVPTV